MGRSDSRTEPLPGLCLPPRRWIASPRRASQVPRLVCPRVLSPLTPESPMAACAHYFTTGTRLHQTWKTGHFPFALTGPYRVRLRYGSRVRLPRLRPAGLLPLTLDWLPVERAITGQAPFSLQDQTRLILARPMHAPPAHRNRVAQSLVLQRLCGFSVRPIRVKRIVTIIKELCILRAAEFELHRLWATRFTSGSWLHHTWETGHFPFALTRPYRVRGRYASWVRRPEFCQSDCSFPPLVGYLLNDQLQGKLPSSYEISQACPGVPGPR